MTVQFACHESDNARANLKDPIAQSEKRCPSAPLVWQSKNSAEHVRSMARDFAHPTLKPLSTMMGAKHRATRATIGKSVRSMKR